MTYDPRQPIIQEEEPALNYDQKRKNQIAFREKLAKKAPKLAADWKRKQAKK